MEKLSIIICSRNKDITPELRENINNTIGIGYELIVIDNSNKNYSIFSAYNEGIRRAKYSYLCFMHEDILYHTKEWGTKVINHLKDPETGIIGIAGGTAFPACPAGWWNGGLLNKTYKNLIQHRTVAQRECKAGRIAEGEDQKLIYHDIVNPDQLNKAKVVSLDGVWLCADSKVFKDNKFDEVTFKGFNCYDTDICFQTNKNYSNYVIFDVLIEHYSIGNLTSDWVYSVELLIDKWKDFLPVTTEQKSGKELIAFTNQNLFNYCKYLVSKGYDIFKVKSVIIKYHSGSNISWILIGYFSVFIWLFAAKKRLLNLKLMDKLFKNIPRKIANYSKHFIANINKKYYFEDYVRVYPDGLVFDSSGRKREPTKRDLNNYKNHVKFYQFAAQFVNNKKVVDVGCGSGYGSKILKGGGSILVDGFDISVKSIEYANIQFKDFGQFRISSITNMNQIANESYNITICSEVLEHIKEYNMEIVAINELKRITTEKGLIIISTPNSELLNDHGFSFEEVKTLISNNFKHYCIFENAFVPIGESKKKWNKRLKENNTGVIISEKINLNESFLPEGVIPEIKQGLKAGIFNFEDYKIDTRLLHNTHSWIIVAIKLA